MKKSILYLATGLSLVMSQACKKSKVSTTETVQNETIDATINSNESYRFSLPAGESTETYNLVNTSSNGSSVVIESNATETTFVYTPASGFSGTESLTISNSEPPANSEHHHGKRPHGKHPGGKHHKKQGGCHSGGNEAKHNITFNITVNAAQN